MRQAHGLAALEQRVRFDLECLNYPPPNWVVATTHPSGDRVHDVVVIGGGMAGLVLTFSLLRNGIRNIRVFDRNPPGREGPWVTYARMETLRSPKVLTGPAAGIPTLTFRAWFVAQFGTAEWERHDRSRQPQARVRLEDNARARRNEARRPGAAVRGGGNQQTEPAL